MANLNLTDLKVLSCELVALELLVRVFAQRCRNLTEGGFFTDKQQVKRPRKQRRSERASEQGTTHLFRYTLQDKHTQVPVRRQATNSAVAVSTAGKQSPTCHVVVVTSFSTTGKAVIAFLWE